MSYIKGKFHGNRNLSATVPNACISQIKASTGLQALLHLVAQAQRKIRSATLMVNSIDTSQSHSQNQRTQGVQHHGIYGLFGTIRDVSGRHLRRLRSLALTGHDRRDRRGSQHAAIAHMGCHRERYERCATKRMRYVLYALCYLRSGCAYHRNLCAL